LSGTRQHHVQPIGKADLDNARDPGGLVDMAVIRDSGASDFTFSYPDYDVYRDSAKSLTGLIAHCPERITLLKRR
jgi:hypothetical protein